MRQICFFIDFNNGKITCAKRIQRTFKRKNPEMYLKQDRDRKRIQREALKKTTKHEAYKAKDRMRIRKQKKSVTTTPTSAVSSPSHSSPLAISSSFCSKQALGKATARATRALPKSPQKKAQILSHLVSHLSPNTKAKVFCSARKKISLELGRPVISAEFKERVIYFLERPDISYCKPGRAALSIVVKTIGVIKYIDQNITSCG